MLEVKPPTFKKVFSRFNELQKMDVKSILDRAGKEGVIALSSATPKDSGEAASSWDYKIEGGPEKYKLIWTNSALAGRAPLVLLIQYGHATKSGSFWSGQDFINPAIDPVYRKLEKALDREVRG